MKKRANNTLTIFIPIVALCAAISVFSAFTHQEKSIKPSNHFFLNKSGFCIEYDGRLKQPSYVVEELTTDSITGTVDRKKFNFCEDDELPQSVRSTLKDYIKNGFDRGHMGFAANHRSNEASMKDSFLLSNISPQNAQFNRGQWAIGLKSTLEA